MVDFTICSELHPTETYATSQDEDIETEIIKRDKLPEDPFLLLLPAGIIGYGVHDKKWRKSSTQIAALPTSKL